MAPGDWHEDSMVVVLVLSLLVLLLMSMIRLYFSCEMS